MENLISLFTLKQQRIKQLEGTIIAKEKIIINLRNKVKQMVVENRQLDQLQDEIYDLKRKNNELEQEIDNLNKIITGQEDNLEEFKSNMYYKFDEVLEKLKDIKYDTESVYDNLDDCLTELQDYDLSV